MSGYAQTVAASDTTSPARTAAVSLTGLVKSYGPVRAVNGLDLTIGTGEVVALLGPNGAGKSTTIDVMLGLATPDSGSARLFGTSSHQAVRDGRVGAMLQSGELLPQVTVREVLGLIAALHKHPLDVETVMRRTGIADLARRRTNKLSGGQAQRVRFAMALLSDPELLVLDEPTAGMDVQSREAFWETMRGQASHGRTIVFATHYLEEADEYADRIVLLAAGRVVADGSITEIRSVAAGRTIRATLPGVDERDLSALPGVRDVEIHGESIVLRCHDSDIALRSLLATYPQARHIEVLGANLTDAFLTLTGGDHA